jgi:CBS domain-containing protein
VTPFTINTNHFLAEIHPYDTLTTKELETLTSNIQTLQFNNNETIYQSGEQLEGLYIIVKGCVSITIQTGEHLSTLREKNSFGERGLLRNGLAATTAVATENTTLLLLPKEQFDHLFKTHPPFQNFFTRSHTKVQNFKPNALASTIAADLMTPTLQSCPPSMKIIEAARLMRDNAISSLIVHDEKELHGIVTLSDISKKVVAEGKSTDGPIREIMTSNPLTLAPDSIGSDILHLMIEKRIGHIPIASNGKLLGIVTKTDLTKFQADSSANLVHDITLSNSPVELATATSRIPQLLTNLVGSGNRHDIITRLITDISDAATRRLLKLAEKNLGPAPVPYLWLACGSQGRQEQTGVSDQDNCLILDDSIKEDDKKYFEELSHFVCDGLNECGYVYCPGDMMATNEQWRQPLSVWRSYFEGWIANPDKQAQMLASVMFDLRPIGGTETLYQDLQAETLEKAAANSIFTAHMIANSITHTPPLGLLRGFATLKSGEHKHHIDLKLNGVVPIVDLGRIYALGQQIKPVNTRARLLAAKETGAISTSGGHDLIDAYDLIAETRLKHQAEQIKQGMKPDNFMRPTVLSDFERSHLRDAFVVVRTMQAAATQGRSVL